MLDARWGSGEEAAASRDTFRAVVTILDRMRNGDIRDSLGIRDIRYKDIRLKKKGCFS